MFCSPDKTKILEHLVGAFIAFTVLDWACIRMGACKGGRDTDCIILFAYLYALSEMEGESPAVLGLIRQESSTVIMT